MSEEKIELLPVEKIANVKFYKVSCEIALAGLLDEL